MANHSFLGFGAGLRSPHYPDLLSGQGKGLDWLEAISENFLGFSESPQGRPLEVLLKLREHFPVVMHGVSLSIGGSDALNEDYLKSLKRLYTLCEPSWISDHLCWTGVHGHNLHDLLPLPYTQETLSHVVGRIQKVQEFLGRQLTIENVSSYITFKHSEMTEWEFLSEIHRRSGCALLLDINNVYVSSFNHNFDPLEFIGGIPIGSVTQFHLAGHSSSESLLIDTHDAPVCDEVWNLYASALKRFGPVSTLIEWDGKIPSLERLEEEVSHARTQAFQIHSSLAEGSSDQPGPNFLGSPWAKSFDGRARDNARLY